MLEQRNEMSNKRSLCDETENHDERHEEHLASGLGYDVTVACRKEGRRGETRNDEE